MATVKSDLEQRLYWALKRIAAYDTPTRLRRDSEKHWGLGFEEAIEMAYENIQTEARTALMGVRLPKPKAALVAGE